MEEDRDFIEFKNIKFYWHPKYKYYLASRCGQILSLKRKKKMILKLQKISRGYFYFQLFKNNSRKIYLVSRFVYETFKGEITCDKQVDHVDNCKENNSISNLQLLTPLENIRKNHFKKKVFSFNIENKEKIIFDSLKEAAEYHQIHKSTVSKICRKKIKSCKSKKDGKKYQFFYFKN